MTPRIRFASSRLGRIAYATIGSGAPLVLDTGWITHVERMWDLPAYREFVQALADSHTVIVFDRPGCGLSERRRDDWSLTAEVDVLRTVLATATAPASLMANSMGVPTAIALAASAPATVDRLVLYGGAAFGADVAPEELRSSLPALVRSSWGLGPRVFADLFFPSEPRETLDWYAALQRDGADGESAARMLELFYGMDVRRHLARIQAPTLVVHRRDEQAVPVTAGVALAEQIPGAQLALLDGDAHPPYMGDVAAVLDAVTEFLGRGDAGEQLSPREHEVAVLVSEGLTNAEIGSRLTISPRTVESHVTRIRTKLDVRSRAQIATWVARRRGR